MNSRKKNDQSSELSALLVHLLDGSIDREKFTVLERRLTDDPVDLAYYIDFMTMWANLDQISDVSTTVPKGVSEVNDPLTSEILREAIEKSEQLDEKREKEKAEQEALIKQDDVKKTAEAMYKEFQERERRRMEKIAYRRYVYRQKMLISGIGVLAASLIIVVLARFFIPEHPPPAPIAPPVVAEIAQSLDAQWNGSGISTVPGTQLTASTMQLKRGLVQITFESGAKVILQAPCTIKPESANQIFLRSGNLTAVVPDKAIGFTVRTPTATMVDYGTEFGVTAGVSGETEVHVFKGEVDLRSGPDTRVFEKSQRLKTSQAGMVDSQGVLSTGKIKYQAKRFIRQMPVNLRFGRPGERLDLSDLIGGGNGFGTGDSNQLINPDNGQIQTSLYFYDRKAALGSSDFIPIANLDFIDGVFIPDGGEGPMVVSSSGHTFNNCPDTNSNFCWDIFNGNFSIEGQCRQILDGSKYATFTHPAISMHSNAGITFDLDKIRASLPGSRIVNFQALCGLADINKEKLGVADFWVLVDGRKRFSMTGAHWQDRARSVHVNLTDKDKFLTLVVTDGGKMFGENDEGGENDSDWGIFAEPALILAPENIMSK